MSQKTIIWSSPEQQQGLTSYISRMGGHFPNQLKTIVSNLILLACLIVLSVMMSIQLAKAQNLNVDPAYATLLKTHIQPSTRDGITFNAINYTNWAKDPNHKMAMANLQKTQPPKKQAEKVAFWINAYNLLTVDLIIKNNEMKSIKNIGGPLSNPWKSNSWNIGTKAYTLHQIEHDILRSMGDARIHMAINCASLSCPDLRNEPYTPAQLNQQLENQTLTFLNGTKGIRTDGTQIQVSKIFHWYKTDFDKGALQFIKTYRKDITAQKISGYLDYNWSLNSQ